MLRTVEQAAGRHHLGRVDRVLPDFDALNHSLLVDEERRPLGQFVTGRPNLFEADRHPVLLEYLPVLIAQERKVNVYLTCVSCVRCRTVIADSENHRVGGFQFGPISLIGF